MSNLSEDKSSQLSILGKLYLIRDLEEAIAARYSEQKMRCPTHLSIGQEGVAAALSVLLTPEDKAVSTHRAHAHYLAKGGSVDAMVAELYGKATGCSGGRGGSMHLIDMDVGFMGSTAIVGNTIPLGVGFALSMQYQKGDAIAVVYLGDGAVEEGVFYEAANFAAVRQLPVLFVCENNLYSVYSGLACRQPEGRKIYEMVSAIGVESAAGDGNDVVAAHGLMHKLVAQIREQRKPMFVEFSTYRWREHCGPNYDNDIGYRSQNEFEQWRQLEPIARYESWLRTVGLVGDKEMQRERSRIQDIIETAFCQAEQAPYPDPSTMHQHLYKEPGE